MPSLLFILFLVLMDGLLVLSFAFVPYVTRKTELFGVSVPSSEIDRPELAALRASYRNQMLVAGAALTVISIAIAALLPEWSNASLFIWLGAVVAYLLVTLVLYMPKHKTMKQLKAAQLWDTTPQKVIVTASTTPASQDTVSPAWLLLFPLVIALGLVALLAIWPRIPDPVPMQYDLSGQVVRAVAKGPRAFLLLPTIETFTALMFAAVFMFVRSAKRQIDAARPVESLQQDRRYRYLTSILLLAIGLLTILFMQSMQVILFLGVSDMLPLVIGLFVFMALLIALVAVLMFRVGQGGSRLSVRDTPPTTAANYDDDRFWKLGLFYVNPDDPAIFVEKRFGLGWTNNLARPATWVIITGFVLATVAFLVLIMSLV